MGRWKTAPANAYRSVKKSSASQERLGATAENAETSGVNTKEKRHGLKTTPFKL
jgi:hypothetical protein